MPLPLHGLLFTVLLSAQCFLLARLHVALGQFGEPAESLDPLPNRIDFLNRNVAGLIASVTPALQLESGSLRACTPFGKLALDDDGDLPLSQ